MANTLFGFVEISGSNAATFDNSSIARIERTFIGPAVNVWPFLRYMQKKPHPAARWAYPVSINVDPALGEGTKSIPPRDPGAAVIGYDYARIRITYGINPQEIALWPEGMTVPRRRKGTWLELKLDAGGEFLKIDNAQWSDNLDEDPFKPVPEGESPALRLYVPQQQIGIIWHNLEWVPQQRFDAAVGKVNRSSFLGKPAGTVLFENYSVDMETTLDFDYPVRWAVTCNFLYRCVTDKGKTYGWNHELRKDGWQQVYVKTTSGWSLRYEETDFTNLFV